MNEDHGYQARKASGYVEAPPPRYRDPEPPSDWPPGPPPVRCIACIHVGTMRFGFCEIAGKRASGVAHWRRCTAFKARPAPGKDRPAEAAKRPAEAPAPTPYREPIERARLALSRAGLMDRLGELVDLGGCNVGVRVRVGLSDREAGEVFDVVAAAMAEAGR